ncbi:MULTISPECIES: type 2 isopentenyl-diphosphate Delta-isomerase [Erysipelothrix]|uniref:type 2 isopentenyl-diphosphate Delta-isomerase n=1 Tax=Erysipelothrix TaxID=1647 RepID=UPI001A9EFD61|nr:MULTISPECIES: type 2 isopentenyl-diphosphate Delta-isomerase [Erysipelothrix]
MSSIRSQRKDDHVAHALEQNGFKNDFELVRFIHNSLPNMNFSDVDLSSHYFGHAFEYPVYINAMTGGSDKTREINQKLAMIAKHFGLAMAVGSQHVALDDASQIPSFSIVRETNPDGFIIGNINANASVDDAIRAIQMIKADALGIHINIAQEITMDEGDRDFAHWLDHIEAIIRSVDVPVIVKEVGFGMSDETVRQLLDRGVRYVDVSGRGGTNFIMIENARSERKRYDYLADWGLTPVESLLMTQPYHHQAQMLASGGVTNPLDVMKLLRLGAHGVGISGYFLKAAHLETDAMFDEVELFLEDLKKLMVLIGASDLTALRKRKIQLLERLVMYDETK